MMLRASISDPGSEHPDPEPGFVEDKAMAQRRFPCENVSPNGYSTVGGIAGITNHSAGVGVPVLTVPAPEQLTVSVFTF